MWQTRIAGAIRNAAARTLQSHSHRATTAAHSATAVRRALCVPTPLVTASPSRCACRSFSTSPLPPPPPPTAELDASDLDAAVVAEAVTTLAPRVDEFMDDGSTAAAMQAPAARHASQADQAAAALAVQRRAVRSLSDSLVDDAHAYDLSSAVSPAPCHPSSLLSLALFNQIKADIHGSFAFVKMCMRASVAPPSSAAHRTWEVVPAWDFNDTLVPVLHKQSANWQTQLAAMATNARVQKESAARAAEAARALGQDPPSDLELEAEHTSKLEPFTKAQILANLPDFFLSPALHQSGPVMDAVKEAQWKFLKRQHEIEQERMQMLPTMQANTSNLGPSPASHRQTKQWKASLAAAWVPRAPALMVALVDAFIAFMNEPVEASAGTTKSPVSEAEILADFSHQTAAAPTVRDELLKMRSGRLRFDPTLAQLTNFSAPHEWFPLARGLARKFIVHVGPTNSGKTYHAMQRLKQAKSGVYAGPLRLLAWEVKDKLTREGIPCTLMTGQEKEEVEGACHISGTVEMVNTDTIVDVAVIDEAQMLASPDRGWAWTRALLGVPAYEVHVCGDPSMVEIVEELCAITGEPVEIREYQRLTPLVVSPPLMNGVRDLRKGDCVVAFGRAKLYDLKRLIEKYLALKVCIIYGSLPPEVRRQQAELFNDPNSGYDILVASDAIGMGLNLNIARVVFAKLEKYDGVVNRALTPSETMQIAGRAGRYNTGDKSKTLGVSTLEAAAASNRGECTTLVPEEHAYLAWAMKQRLTPIDRVGLAPTYEQLAELHALRPKETLSNLLTYFGRYAQLDSLYFTVNMEGMKAIAAEIEDVPFQSMRDRYYFCLAPARMDVDSVARAMKVYAGLFARGQKVPANALKLQNLKHANQQINLSMMETFYQVLDLYVWLGLRFTETAQFCDLHKTTEIRDTVGRIVQRNLGDITPSDAYLEKRRKQLAKQSEEDVQLDMQRQEALSKGKKTHHHHSRPPLHRPSWNKEAAAQSAAESQQMQQQAQQAAEPLKQQQQPQQHPGSSEGSHGYTVRNPKPGNPQRKYDGKSRHSNDEQRSRRERAYQQDRPDPELVPTASRLVRSELRRVTANEQRASVHADRKSFSGLRKDRPFEPRNAGQNQRNNKGSQRHDAPWKAQD